MSQFNINNLVLDEITAAGELMFRNPDSGDTVKHKKATFQDLVDFLDAEGVGAGLPNYLSKKLEAWTDEAGWTLTEETVNPIDLEGTIKASVANGTAADVGFYQDVVISEIDKQRVLQLMCYFADSADTDFGKIDFEVLDKDDSDRVILEGNLLDFASLNNATGIYSFNATPQSTDNVNYRVRIKTNDAIAVQMDMFFSRFFLGQVSAFTGPLNGFEAGDRYDTTEAPVDGLNASGDLCLDGSTFNFVDYPDIQANLSKLTHYITDNGDGTFTTRKLSYETAWIYKADYRNTSMYISHGLDRNPADLIIKMLVSQAADGSTVQMEIGNNSNTADISGNPYGIQLMYPTANIKNDVVWYTSSYGVVYSVSGGGHSVLTTQGWYYKCVVKRPDAPAEGAYAYIRAKNQQTVELLAKQTSRKDYSQIVYDAIAPDTTVHLGPNGELPFNSSWDFNFSDFPEVNAGKAALIAAGKIIDNLDGTFTMQDISPALGWRTVSSGAPITTLAVGNGFYRVKIQSGTSRWTGIIKIEDQTNIFIGSWAADQTFSYQAGTWSSSLYNIYAIEKLEETAYAYLQTKSLSQIVMAENLNQPGYNGTVYRPTTQDISTADKTSGLDQYLSTGVNPKLDGWRIKLTWTGGNGTYAHIIDSSLNLWNEYVDLPPGDNSTTFAWCGYGSGGLELEKDEANSRWIVVTEGYFDKGVNGNGEWRAYTDKTLLFNAVRFLGYTGNAGYANVTWNFPIGIDYVDSSDLQIQLSRNTDEGADDERYLGGTGYRPGSTNNTTTVLYAWYSTSTTSFAGVAFSVNCQARWRD